MKEQILQAVNDVVRASQMLTEPQAVDFIEQAAKMLFTCYRKKGKVLVAGNGGSLCDAMHFAEELTGQFRKMRPALAAIALSDPGHMSCVGNDMGFESIFSRGVEALGRPEDVLVVLTTSGNSTNLVRAVQAALKKQMKVIGFLGRSGGQLRGMCHLEWIVSGFPFSDRVQEAHMAAIHVMIEMLESLLYAKQNLLMGAAAH